jgi:hypothetical protein
MFFFVIFQRFLCILLVLIQTGIALLYGEALCFPHRYFSGWCRAEIRIRYLPSGKQAR